jgi:aspartyl protease family protein
MSIAHVEVQIANLAEPDRTEMIELLVDSGATYSVVPATVLEGLGIRPLTEQVYRLAKGERITRRKSGALFRQGDRVGVADVVFGEDGDSRLLGATTLEALGLALDPLRRDLRERPLMLG